MKISNKKLLKSFEENGYVVIPNFLSKREINFIFRDLHNLINFSLLGAKLKKRVKLKSLDNKYSILLKKNKLLKSHFYDMIPFTEEVNKLASSKKFINLAKLLLREKNIFTNTKQIRIDHVKDSYFLPQHQELGQISNKLVIFWIPLVDLNKNLGGLYIRPRTHKLGHLPYQGSNLEARKAGMKRKYIIEKLFQKSHLKKYVNMNLKLKAGDAVIFHNYLFHGSMPNKNSKKARWVFISRYNSIRKTPYIRDAKSPFKIPYDADYNRL